MEDEKYMTGPEVRKLLKITKQTLVALKKRPDFPRSYRPTGRDLWKKSDIEDYLRLQKAGK